jgi:hypothetical protein
MESQTPFGGPEGGDILAPSPDNIERTMRTTMSLEQSFGSSTTTVPKRREPRVAASLNVRVLGIDADGKPFHQEATTIDISLSGARVSGVTARLNPGDVVGLTSGGGKSRFQVIWIQGNRDGSFVMGLYCVEKGACPWRENLQPSMLKIPGKERRTSSRYACQGAATLRAPNATTSTFGTVRDVSENGCYVQTENPLEVGEFVGIQFAVQGTQINALAEVSNSVPDVGMGLRWCDLGVDGEGRLNRILDALQQKSGDTHANKEKAMSELGAVHQLVDSLKQRIGFPEAVVGAHTMELLTQAREKLAAALRALDS